MTAGSRSAIVVTPRLPWPLDDGGKIALWQSVWAAAQEYRTTLVSLYDPARSSPDIPAHVTKLGIEVVAIPHVSPPTAVAAWRGLVGPWPYTLERFRSSGLSAALRHLVAEREPAFALVNNLHLAPYVEALGHVPMLLREHNVEYAWMSRYASSQPAGPRKLYARVQADRLRTAERRLCELARMVLAISAEETKQLEQLSPKARVRTLPLGIDFSAYRAPEPEAPPVVLVVGAFGWEPNVAGAIRFLESGWPRLHALVPQARLRLAGKEPSVALREAARRAGAEVTGYVPSMSDEFARAALLLVPLWAGAGIRVKIVEAFAARLPVVATPLGAEGLGLQAGAHYLEGDTPERLADQAAGLLASQDRGRDMARLAHEIAAKRWSLPGVAALQNRYCEEALAL